MERNKAIALLLLVVAVLLPPHWTAAALAGSSPHLASVQMGVWIVKATLALHALILALASRLPLGTDGPSAESPPAIPSSGSRMVLAGLLIIGLALRLHDLGVGLWFDEIQTMVDYVRLPLGQILSTYDSQNQHMLYSVLARLSVDLFGDSGWSLRLPAALMGTASLWATYRLASRLTSEREALLATLLLTVSYHHVWFSQNARGYSGLLLFSLLGTEAFLRLTGPSQAGWKTAVFYATCMALAIYTHVTAAFVVVAHAVIALVIWWRQGRSLTTPVRRALAGIILTGTFSLQLYALVLPQFFDTLLTPTMAGTDTAWKDPLWLLTETLNGLARGLPGGWIVLVGGLVVAGAGLWSYARQSLTVVSLFVLPGVITMFAVLAMSHNLWPRFFFFSAGFAVMIAVRGGFTISRLLFKTRGELLATAAMVLVAVGSALTVPRAWQPKQDYAGAAGFVEARRAPEDVIVTVDLTRYPYARYFGKSWDEVDNLAALEAAEGQHARTWVVYTFPIRLAAVQPEIWSRLESRYDTAAVFPGSVGGGAIVVLVSRSSNSPT